MNRQIFLYAAPVFALAFFAGLAFDLLWLRVVTKPLVVLSLALALLPATEKFDRLILTAFVFSAAGDLLLELPYDLFTEGLVAFLTAHVFFIWAFLTRDKRFDAMSLIIIAAFGAAEYAFLLPHLGEMKIPVLMYLIVILLMTWRAYVQRNFNPYAKFAFYGAVAFVLSDSLIALNRFVEPVCCARWIIMLLYWTAQALIFLSAKK